MTTAYDDYQKNCIYKYSNITWLSDTLKKLYYTDGYVIGECLEIEPVQKGVIQCSARDVIWYSTIVH